MRHLERGHGSQNEGCGTQQIGHGRLQPSARASTAITIEKTAAGTSHIRSQEGRDFPSRGPMLQQKIRGHSNHFKYQKHATGTDHFNSRSKLRPQALGTSTLSQKSKCVIGVGGGVFK
jgi:hypothetical protein